MKIILHACVITYDENRVHHKWIAGYEIRMFIDWVILYRPSNVTIDFRGRRTKTATIIKDSTGEEYLVYESPLEIDKLISIKPIK